MISPPSDYKAYRRVLAQLTDLGFDGGPKGSRGEYAGRRVVVTLVPRNDTKVVVARAVYEPLDLGLGIRQRTFVPLLGAPDAATGDDSLDSQYAFEFDDRDQLRALVTAPLAAALRDAYVGGRGVVLTDTGCSAEISSGPSPGDDDDGPEQVLGRITTFARLVDEARAGLPAPRALAGHAATLSAWSERRGLGFVASQLRVHGEVDGRETSIRAVRDASGHRHLEVSLRFASKLGLGLALGREGVMAGIRRLFGVHDVEVGDARFDARFRIRMNVAAQVLAPQLFADDLRALFLDTDERHGPVSLDDVGISVGPIAPDAISPAALVELAESMADAAGRVERAALGQRRAEGPYR